MPGVQLLRADGGDAEQDRLRAVAALGGRGAVVEAALREHLVHRLHLRRGLLELTEDRYERRATIITSQIPVDRWYEIIGNPTIADAIMDRIAHNAYRIELAGESMRKRQPQSHAAASA